MFNKLVCWWKGCDEKPVFPNMWYHTDRWSAGIVRCRRCGSEQWVKWLISGGYDG